MKKIWLSLTSEKIYKSEAEAFQSQDDFVEGFYCKKCNCTTTSECACKN